MRDGEARIAKERIEDGLCVEAGGPRVPEAERRHAVRVDMLGCALELSEGGDGVPRLGGLGMFDLEQNRLVALDDQWTIAHL